MKQITPAQLKKLHVLLGQADLMERKSDLVYSFSNGRTESSRNLTLFEAKEMIEYLQSCDKRSRIIKAIWYLARQANIISGNNWEDNKMNAAKLDSFCQSRGAVKKAVGEQSLNELKKTQRQFEAIYKHQVDKGALKAGKVETELRLKECVAREDYEGAVLLKKLIDDIDKELHPRGSKKVNKQLKLNKIA